MNPVLRSGIRPVAARHRGAIIHATDDVAVLIVDDQATFRAVARTVVALSAGFTVVAEAETGEDAVATAAANPPDLVLMDVNLPGIDGGEATRRIVAARPSTVVILMSTYAADDLAFDPADTGAVAYVHKENLDADVLDEVWAHHRPPVKS